MFDPLSGYVHLAERLVTAARTFPETWHFRRQWRMRDPSLGSSSALVGAGQGELSVQVAPDSNDPHEARLVKLDASKTRERLGLTPRWSLDRAIEAIVDWYDAYRDGRDLRAVTLDQIEAFGR